MAVLPRGTLNKLSLESTALMLREVMPPPLHYPQELKTFFEVLQKIFLQLDATRLSTKMLGKATTKREAIVIGIKEVTCLGNVGMITDMWIDDYHKPHEDDNSEVQEPSILSSNSPASVTPSHPALLSPASTSSTHQCTDLRRTSTEDITLTAPSDLSTIDESATQPKPSLFQVTTIAGETVNQGASSKPSARHAARTKKRKIDQLQSLMDDWGQKFMDSSSKEFEEMMRREQKRDEEERQERELLRQCESDGLRFLSRLWLNFIGVQLVYFCNTVFNRYSFTCSLTEIVHNNASYHHTTDCLDRVLTSVFKGSSTFF
ncbi:hypothetical protein QQF64_033992 [Cirrhinus molitorella]|uniref:Uncharacterized protein n=1 Tax=Cirrhinus molitorella TaxID=172907 RepID=A0ABR3MVH1_9TELE